MTSITSSQVNEYLSELDRALHQLPRGRRHEIVTDIRLHIESALADSADDGAESPERVESILYALGTPADIAAAACEDLPLRPPRVAVRDIIAIVLLLVGGVVLPVIGWFVGLILLWTSPAWHTRDKIIGTVLVPGGVLAPILLLGLAVIQVGGGSCTGGSVSDARTGQIVSTETTCTSTPFWHTLLVIAIFAVAVLGPLFSTIWLSVRARRLA